MTFRNGILKFAVISILLAAVLYGCAPSGKDQAPLDNPPQESLKKSALLDPAATDQAQAGSSDVQELPAELEASAPALEEEAAPQGPITYQDPPEAGGASQGGVGGGDSAPAPAPAPAQGEGEPSVGFTAPDFSLKTLDGGGRGPQFWRDGGRRKAGWHVDCGQVAQQRMGGADRALA